MVWGVKCLPFWSLKDLKLVVVLKDENVSFL